MLPGGNFLGKVLAKLGTDSRAAQALAIKAVGVLFARSVPRSAALRDMVQWPHRKARCRIAHRRVESSHVFLLGACQRTRCSFVVVSCNAGVQCTVVACGTA